MLFFFELFLFVLIMLTMALGEFVSRALALTLWLVATAFALVGYLLARRPLRRMMLVEGSAVESPAAEAHASAATPAEGPAPGTPLSEVLPLGDSETLLLAGENGVSAYKPQ